MEFYTLILDVLIYALIGSIASAYYYYYKRKSLVGGFGGGMVIGISGAILVTILTTIQDWFTRLIIWLMLPKIIFGFHFRVNIITACIGAFIFLAILNHINHNRER